MAKAERKKEKKRKCLSHHNHVAVVVVVLSLRRCIFHLTDDPEVAIESLLFWRLCVLYASLLSRRVFPKKRTGRDGLPLCICFGCTKEGFGTCSVLSTLFFRIVFFFFTCWFFLVALFRANGGGSSAFCSLSKRLTHSRARTHNSRRQPN